MDVQTNIIDISHNMEHADILNFKQNIANMSKDDMNVYLERLAVTNTINPNKNRYSSYTEEEYKKCLVKMKERTNRMKMIEFGKINME